MTTFSSDPRLPIIDLSLFDAGDPWRDHLAAQIDWASSEFGFFYIVEHGIDRKLIASLMESSRCFFVKDTAVKRRIEMSLAGRAWRGYFPVGQELTSGKPDLKEGIYFGSEQSQGEFAIPLHGQNLFPDIPGFRELVLAYLAALTGLGHRLMAAISRGLGLAEDYFAAQYTADPTILFRLFNYPQLRSESAAAQPACDEQWGVGAHTDYGLLTILKQDGLGGLELKHRDRWLEVPDVPDSFVCNVGDMLERLTNGRYVSALHRVRNSREGDRLSMPFFFDAGFAAVLEPIPGVRPTAPRPELAERWDGANLRDVRGTYGEYLIGKVSKVFPELGQRHLA